MSDPDYAYFATYVVATSEVLQTGGCPRSDLALQSSNLPPGAAVMEIEPGQSRIGRYRVDLTGDHPRFVVMDAPI